MSQNLSQILSAMMASTRPPVVTPMGAAGAMGSGGRVSAMKGSGLSRRPQRRAVAVEFDSPDVMDTVATERQTRAPELDLPPYDPNLSPDEYKAQFARAEQKRKAELNADKKNQIEDAIFEAQEDVRRWTNPRGFSDNRRAREELPKARRKLHEIEQAAGVHNSEQVGKQNKIVADDIYKRALQVFPQEQAQAIADSALKNPESVPEIMKELNDAMGQVRGERASTIEAMRGEFAGYAREDKKEDQDSAEMYNAIINATDMPTDVASSVVQTDSSFTEITEWWDGQKDSILEGQLEDSKSTMRRMETYSSASRITDQITGIREHLDAEGFSSVGAGGAVMRRLTSLLDAPTGEGEVGKFDSFTNAGILDRLVDPIISKIGLQAINQMRQMSESGGALGNVSNFEVRMVQASLASLNTGLPEDEFRAALDIVDTAFKRAAFLAKNAPDMEAAARKAGIGTFEYMTKELDRRYPLNPEFEKSMNLEGRTPWDTDSAPTGEWSMRPAGGN